MRTIDTKPAREQKHADVRVRVPRHYTYGSYVNEHVTLLDAQPRRIEQVEHL